MKLYVCMLLESVDFPYVILYEFAKRDYPIHDTCKYPLIMNLGIFTIKMS